MAINNQSNIAPIINRGGYEALPYKSLCIKPGNITLTFLDPISTKGMNYENRDRLIDQSLTITLENGLEK